VDCIISELLPPALCRISPTALFDYVPARRLRSRIPKIDSVDAMQYALTMVKKSGTHQIVEKFTVGFYVSLL
jgi:hypothetical protein